MSEKRNPRSPEQMAKRAAYKREWYQRNRETVLAKIASRTDEDKAAIAASRRERYKNDPDYRAKVIAATNKWRTTPGNREKTYPAQRAYDNSPIGQATRRRDRLMRYFQMTPEQYAELFEKQGGVCAVCQQPETQRHRGTGPVISLSVDHDHSCCPGKTSCGKCIRGLLCDRCNNHRWSEDPALLRAAADYFERTSVRV